jgi:iron complex transport system ATP-binding protein
MGQDILPPYGFTAYEVARLGRYPHQRFGRTQADDHALTLEALRQTDSESLAERQFATLSGGERARVTLARVLAQGTRLLLLDEPSATLDLRHQQALMRLLRRLAAEGCAIVLSLHDLNLAAVYADTLALLRGGALYAYGTPCAVLTPANIEAVFGLQALVLPHPRLGESVPLIVPS